MAGGARCVLGWYRPSAGVPGALCVRKKFQSVRVRYTDPEPASRTRSRSRGASRAVQGGPTPGGRFQIGGWLEDVRWLLSVTPRDAPRATTVLPTRRELDRAGFGSPAG